MRFVCALMLMVTALLGSLSAIYAHRVARLVPFAKDYGVPAHVRYITGRIPVPLTYIDVAHRDCPDWIKQEYRHHCGVSVAAATFSVAAFGAALLVAKIAGQL